MVKLLLGVNTRAKIFRISIRDEKTIAYCIHCLVCHLQHINELRRAFLATNGWRAFIVSAWLRVIWQIWELFWTGSKCPENNEHSARWSWVILECEIFEMSDHYTEQRGADYHAVHCRSWVSGLATYSVIIKMKAIELVIAFGAVSFVILYTACSTAFPRIAYTLSHILLSLEIWPNSFMTVVFPSFYKTFLCSLSVYQYAGENQFQC